MKCLKFNFPCLSLIWRYLNNSAAYRSRLQLFQHQALKKLAGDILSKVYLYFRVGNSFEHFKYFHFRISNC